MTASGAPQRKSYGGAIVLIALGMILLFFNLRTEFNPWPILERYWPLILIFLGLGKMWDYFRRRQHPEEGGGGGISGGAIAMLVLLVVFGVALWRGGAAGPLQYLKQSIDRQGAKSVHAKVDLSAGTLRMSGGASSLLDADFKYSESDGKPQVDYSVADSTGQLSIHQPNQGVHMGRAHNEWDLRLGSDVPFDLDLNMGAGQGNLRMGGVNLTRLAVNMGAGQLDLDLTGERRSDLQADIHGGVGQATIRLPKQVGVRVHASGGIGSIEARGLLREEGAYVNAAYGKSPVTIRMNVEGGVGQIVLEQEP